MSTVNYEREGLNKVLELFDKWISSVIAVGFKNIFLDEPHVETKTLQFINKVYKKYHEVVEFYLRFCDAKFNTLSEEQIGDLPVKNTGLSAYFWTNDDAKIAALLTVWLTCLLKMRPTENNHIWIQGFDLPQGREHIPSLVFSIASQLGIKNFGFWGYKSAEATSTKRTVNYKLVWKQAYNLFNSKATA